MALADAGIHALLVVRTTSRLARSSASVTASSIVVRALAVVRKHPVRAVAQDDGSAAIGLELAPDKSSTSDAKSRGLIADDRGHAHCRRPLRSGTLPGGFGEGHQEGALNPVRAQIGLMQGRFTSL